MGVAALLVAIAVSALGMPSIELPDVPTEGPARLVRNINQSRDPRRGSDPNEFVRANGFLYFLADDNEHGRELWRSDRTPTGTVAWRALGFAPDMATSHDLLRLGEDLIAVGDGVWRSDGTAAGTQRLLDGPNWTAIATPHILYLLRDAELWISDGTASGTRRLSVTPGHPDTRVNQTVVSDDQLYFTLCDPDWRCEVWLSDGTPSGTNRVSELPHQWIVELIASERGAFIVTRDDTGSHDLWFASPAAAAAHLASFPNDDSAGAWYAVGDPILFRGGLFFVGCRADIGCEPWWSDGTAAGTGPLADIGPGDADGMVTGEHAAEYGIVGNAIYFLGRGPDTGVELWRSDGTPAGTQLVRDVNPGPADGVPQRYDFFASYRPFFTTVGGTLFFAASDGVRGFELWRTDGTGEGTSIVADLLPGAAGVFDNFASHYQCEREVAPVVVSGTLFFVACVESEEDEFAWQLWRSDGSATGTTLVDADVEPQLLGFGDRLFFVRRDQAEWTDRLVVTSGSGTEELAVETRAGDLHLAQAFPDGIIFTVGYWRWLSEPWWSDGSPSGTYLLRDIASDEAGSTPEEITALGDQVLFLADDGVHGRELWRSDASDAGTRLVADLHPGAADAQASQLTRVGDAVVFVADDGVHGLELWRSDGTAEGTAMLADILPGAGGSLPDRFTVVGDVAYFFADDGVHGRELWRTDATAAGTELVRDIRSGPAGSDIYWAYEHWPMRGPGAAWQDALYFTADDGTSGRDLWRSDGTADGTELVADLPETEYGRIYEMTPAGDILLFSRTGQCPCTWATDGTAEGTVRLDSPSYVLDGPVTVGGVTYAYADVGNEGYQVWQRPPGGPWTLYEPMSVGALFGVDDVLFGLGNSGLWRADAGFLRTDGNPEWYGYRSVSFDRRLLYYDPVTAVMWSSDGTPEGTAPLQRVAEPQDGRPDDDDMRMWGATRAGDHIFFGATSGGIGAELWALPVDALAEVCVDDCPWLVTPTATPTPEPDTPSATPEPPTATPTPDCGGPCTVVRVGEASGAPGETPTIAARLAARGEPVVALDLRIDFVPAARIAATERARPDCAVDASIDKPATTFTFVPPHCDPAADCTGVRALILALDNVDPIADGSTLFTCRLEIGRRARPGRYALPLTLLGAANAGGEIEAAAESGSVTVLAHGARALSDANGDGCQTGGAGSGAAWPLLLAGAWLWSRRRSTTDSTERLPPYRKIVESAVSLCPNNPTSAATGP